MFNSGHERIKLQQKQIYSSKQKKNFVFSCWVQSLVFTEDYFSPEAGIVFYDTDNYISVITFRNYLTHTRKSFKVFHICFGYSSMEGILYEAG